MPGHAGGEKVEGLPNFGFKAVLVGSFFAFGWIFQLGYGFDANMGWFVLSAWGIAAILLGSFQAEWNHRLYIYKEYRSKSAKHAEEYLWARILFSLGKFNARLQKSSKGNPLTEANELMDLVQIFLCLSDDARFIRRLHFHALDTRIEIYCDAQSGAPKEVILKWEKASGGSIERKLITQVTRMHRCKLLEKSKA